MPKKAKDKEESSFAKVTDSNGSEIEKIIAERDEYLAGWKRSLADLENYKRRVEEEKSFITKLLKASVINKILPIKDSLDKAFQSVPEDQKDADWVKGMTAIRGQFEDFLKSEGVKRIETEGEMFDPNRHEALLEEASDEKEGKILEEFEAGYEIDDKIIRYPKVKVSKKK